MWKFNGSQRPSFALPTVDGQESVWDYPRPPKLVTDSREVIVRLGDLEIAKTKSAVRVLETASPPTVYLPPTDINFDYLEQVSGSSFCEWKGAATYWSVVTPTKTLKKVGWSYSSPTDRFSAIQGYLSFYPAHLECWLDGERVQPQPGGFYGGWVTKEIIGPYKGESGTMGW